MVSELHSVSDANPRPGAPTAPSIAEPVISAKELLGVRFHSLRIPDVLQWIDRRIERREARQVCLVNAYTVALCRNNAALRRVVNEAGLSLADGTSIVWGGRWLGFRLPGRIAGPDLMEAVCARAVERQHRIFLMGSSPENLEQLESVLVKRWPALRIAGTHSPSYCDQFHPEESRRIVERIREAGPDILFVGISAPKQEMWIAENLKHLDVPVCLGVGAAFDFLSGRMPRAPERLQSIGLEWLYRLYREPKRLWKRYLLGNFVFLSLLAKEALRVRWSK